MKHSNYNYVSIVLVILLIFNLNAFAQVGIGTITPNQNAILDIDVSSLNPKKGFLPPRMTTIDKTTLGSSLGLTDEGMLVFDTDLTALYYWDGLKWELIRIDSVVTDKDSMGNMYLVSTSTTIISTANSPTKILGSTMTENLTNFTNDGGLSNRLLYTGNNTRTFSIVSSLSFQGDGINNTLFSFYIAKGTGGVTAIIPSTKVYRFIASTGDVGALSISGTVSLSNGDWVEVWVEAESPRNLIVRSLNLLIY